MAFMVLKAVMAQFLKAVMAQFLSYYVMSCSGERVCQGQTLSDQGTQSVES